MIFNEMRSKFALAAGFVMSNALIGAVLAETVDKMTKIRITASGKHLTATLEDSTAARDFLSLLPMTVTLEDYHKIEKISDLPRRLSTEGEPAGLDPEVGDITYYAPWGNLAIFYQDFGYASGLVRLRKIEEGIELLNRTGPFRVTIEVVPSSQ